MVGGSMSLPETLAESLPAGEQLPLPSNSNKSNNNANANAPNVRDSGPRGGYGERRPRPLLEKDRVYYILSSAILK